VDDVVEGRERHARATLARDINLERGRRERREELIEKDERREGVEAGERGVVSIELRSESGEQTRGQRDSKT
jgi:hypothetical protein